MVISFKYIHRFCLIISCIMFACNSYSMEREIVQSNHVCNNTSMLLEIVAHQDFSFFNTLSLPESLKFVSALSYVNKQCNKVCNCPIFTRKFMRYGFDKHVGGKCGVYEADFVKRLRTHGARQYKMLSEELLNVRVYNLNMDAIKTWIKNGADVRYRKTGRLWCTVGFIDCPLLFPLSNAVAQNLTIVVSLLFTHGADVQGYGATLLNMAIEHGNEEIVRMLLNRGVVIDKPRDGISSVARAVRCGKNAILKIFSERGIDFNNLVTDCFGEKYPLFIAADREQWKSGIFLLECGAVKGAREAFDLAKSFRRIRVTDLRCRRAVIYTCKTRENVIEEVYTIDAAMKALFLTKTFSVTDQDVQEALDEKDKNLLRLYCECDKNIAPQILTIYPDVLESYYR